MNDFNPNWVSAPGDTIEDILIQKNISVKSFSEIMNLHMKDSLLLLGGELLISDEIAEKLASIASTKQFWINRERNFREGLKKA